MSEQNLEDWDAGFLEELFQAEELALSCSSSNRPPPPPPPPSSSYLPPLPPQPQKQQHFPAPSRNDFVSYSPPRELSQRTADYGSALTGRGSNSIVEQCAGPSTFVRGSDCAKDLEIERLKKELGRVSKQLTELEHECSDLKKERNMEDRTKFKDSRNEVKVANFHSLKTEELEHRTPVAAHHRTLQDLQRAKTLDDRIDVNIEKSSCKAVGVQTELNTCLDLSKKLQGIWCSGSGQNFRRNMISKLFASCATDFNVLFGFMNMNSSSKIADPLVVESNTNRALQQHVHSFCASEAAKVSYLYSVMTQISNGMLPLDALIEALFDLCTIENAIIVYRSLHILHVLLKLLLAFERKSEVRKNVMVEGLHSGSCVEDACRCGTGALVGAKDEASHSNNILSEAETLWSKGNQSTGNAMLFSCINWVSLFQFMRQIAMRTSEEGTRFEAVSIMKVILMRSNAYTEREKFGLIPVFESISQLLKKEAGLCVQKEALHLLHLLLNSPKLLATFCAGCTRGESGADANDNEENDSSCKAFTMILEGLADCTLCSGNSLQELELHRNAVISLAFIASSGKSGFEILVNHKLSRESNFLMLILQLLVSELDVEATGGTESAEIFRARTLLVREVLILLNRLVSNPVHSATVLRLLTNSRDMANLTIDIASRLSRKEQKPTQDDNMTRHMRESEIIDLGRVFKKRVFTYLGDLMH